MFWRFGFHNPSAVDTLLDREDVCLEELLDEEDLLQEAKSHNQKLVEFLCTHDNLAKILYYVTAPDIDEEHKQKYPFLSCEIICCEIPDLIDAIVIKQPELLESLWTYLDRPVTDGDQGADTLQASYFCKVISVLLTKQTAEVLEFIKSKPENLQKILARLKTSAFMDLLLTLVRMEELPEGKGIVQWLSDLQLLEHLVDRLHPDLDTEEHSVAQQCICEIIRMSQTSLLESPSLGFNDLIVKLKSETTMEKLAGFMLDAKAPHATSTLINGVTIIIDLIRHNNSDMDNDPMMTSQYSYAGNTPVRETSVSLADMLRVLANHVGEFNELLIHPRPTDGPTRATTDKAPLGFERLKICELFAELLHCSNMSNLNSTADDVTDVKQQGHASLDLPADTDESAKAVEQPQRQEKTGEGSKMSEPILPIGDYLKAKLVGHKVLPTCTELFFSYPWNNFLHYVVYDMLHQVFNGRMDKGYNRHLAISVLKDGHLTTEIVKAQRKNDDECAKTKGTRLGYMGHITFISDEITKLFEGYPEAIVAEIKEDVDLPLWAEYCEKDLKETKERDRLPLGGDRPNDEIQGSASEEEDGLSGEAKQFSHFNQSEEEDEDDDHWITGSGDVGRDQPMNHQVALDEEDDYGSDEEENSSQVITHDWTRKKDFSVYSSLHRTQSHVREEGDEEDKEYDPLADTNELEHRTSLRRTDSKPDETHGASEEAFGDLVDAEDTVSNKLGNLEIDDDKPEKVEDVVRAIKTKEEESKHIKEYRTDDEQEGEI